MRFSRANLSDASACDNDDHRSQEARHHGVASPPQGQAGQVVTLRAPVEGESNAASFDTTGGEFGRAAWQQYFFLAPNVRFTRTPDSDKRPAPQPDDEAPAKAACRCTRRRRSGAIPAQPGMAS